MKLYIDADACPVVDIAIKSANEFNIETILVCDTAHILKKENSTTIVVEQGKDSADLKIANLISKYDIVVTQDYGLAAMCLAKSAYALNQNGLIYTADNIDSLLLSRHSSAKVRRSGGRTKGPSKRTYQQDIDFEKSLKKLLTEVVK